MPGGCWLYAKKAGFPCTENVSIIKGREPFTARLSLCSFEVALPIPPTDTVLLLMTFV